MQKQYYDYNTFLIDYKKISKMLQNKNIDAIIAIARGGVTFGHFLSLSLGIRQFYTINAISYNDTLKLDKLMIYNIPKLNNCSKVLICDDIIDSGDTMKEVLNILQNNYSDIEFETIALFYKLDAKISPTYKTSIAKCWIDFFWEKD